ncbi:MAG: SAM-dependent chlorinase/fluorinase [Vampirovibrionales bacterium]|nr:SAM-dependent chlorinase/fluorinase [Vampirovibrionales bacterium]
MTFKAPQPTIAMITDYGEKDGFPGIMKGILYKTIHQAMQTLPTQQVMPPVVDITHQVEPFNIAEGAWVLNRCYGEFPENTIFICVVDPGVGKDTQNKLLLSWPERKQIFIGPDNGVFTPIIKAADGQLKAFAVTNTKLFRQSRQQAEDDWQADVSQTFHGRDIYAPVAGHMAYAMMTFMCEEFLLTVGERLDVVELVCLETPEPRRETSKGKDALLGHIAHTDNFGNLTTNIPAEWLAHFSSAEVSVELPSHAHQWVGKKLNNYSEGKDADDVFVVPASSGTLELALFQRNASAQLKAKTGDPVVIRMK